MRGRTAVLAAAVLVAGCGIGTVARSAPSAGPGHAETRAAPEVTVAPGAPGPGAVGRGTPPGAPEAPPAVSDAEAPAELEWAPLGEPGIGGRVTDVAIDPHDPDRLLVGGDLIGVGVSTDGGTTWGVTSGLTNAEVGRFTFHPARPGEVWVGTMGGPFVSPDGGTTWEERRAGLPDLQAEYYSAPVEEVLVDPADPSHLLALGGSHREWTAYGDPAWGAVWESRDGGGTWARLATVAGGTNLVDGAWLADGSVLAAALGRGVWRSEDGGRTWLPASSGLPSDVRALASHPALPTTVWAAAGSLAPGGGAAPGGVWRSDDGGRNWSPASAGLDASSTVPGSPEHTARYVALAVAPSDPAVLLTSNVAFGGEAVFRSADGGATWAEVLVDGGFRRPVTAYATPVGAEAIAIDAADAARAVLGNAEYVLATADGGASWEDLTSDLRGDGTFSGRGYSGLVANRVVVDPVGDAIVLCGFDGANPLVSVDGVRGWHRPLVGWDRWGGCHDAAPVGDGSWWVLLGQAGTFNGVAWFDGGRGQWRAFAGDGLPERGSYVGDLGGIEVTRGADGATVVLASIGGALFRSADGGEAWQAVPGVPDAGDLEDDPAHPGLVHVASSIGVWASHDAGAGFSPLAGSPAGATRLVLTGGTLYAVAFRQGDGGLHRLAPGGAWERLLADPLVADVAADPGDPRHLIAVANDHPYHDRVASVGVLRSLDGGASWAPAVAGLPLHRVSTVAFDPARRRVIVGTFGRGFFAESW